MPPKKKLKKRLSFEEVEEDEEASVEDAHINEAIQAEQQQRSLGRKQRRQSASAEVKCFV